MSQRPECDGTILARASESERGEMLNWSGFDANEWCPVPSDEMIREAFEYVLGDVEVARVEMKFVLTF
jgi:hypothetical protein